MKQYIEQNKDRFLEELFSLIRIPSISSEQEHKGDMVRCAERWKELLLEAGADRAEDVLRALSSSPLLVSGSSIAHVKSIFMGEPAESCMSGTSADCGSGASCAKVAVAAIVKNAKIRVAKRIDTPKIVRPGESVLTECKIPKNIGKSVTNSQENAFFC